MDRRTRKLARSVGVSLEVAEALIAAGLTTENRAKNASEKELTAIPGIGRAMAKKIRGK